jgi:two-component system cell cycle response regulator
MSDKKKPTELDRTVVKSDTTVKTQISRWESLASLVLWLPTSRRGEQFVLDKTLVVGRSKSSDIYVDDSGMSKSHGRFIVDGDTVGLIDLDSTNGTYIDREKLEPNKRYDLIANCSIRMGSTVFMYYKPGSMEASKVSAVFKQAYLDPLTGTLNKRALLEKGPELIEKVRERSGQLAMLMFDIDFFKKINDEHPGGHLAGDYVLKELAALIQNSIIRSDDLFTRFGGEEFVILLMGATQQASMEIAERIRKEVQNYQFSYNGTPVPVTVSIGVSMLQDKENLDSLMQRADQALYSAKQSGRNCCEFK